MAWYSILPTHLTTYETWIIRAFLVLAIINIAPWIIAILYDLLYYVGRIVWHEIPIWGGRARGERRPRAPSLRNRSRGMSLAGIGIGAGDSSQGDTAAAHSTAMEDQEQNQRKRGGQAATAGGGVGESRKRKTSSSFGVDEKDDDT